MSARRPWFNDCQGDTQGEPRPNLHNALLALRRDPLFDQLFRYDEMLRAAVLVAAVPEQSRHREGFPAAVDDGDISAIQAWMQAYQLEKMGKETVRQAVDLLALEQPCHPVRDWLRSLLWDGETRLGGWLHHCLGTEDNDYYAAIGAWMLRAMVARIYQPGCKCDYMPVLEGTQGILKSQALRVLGGQYFDDNLPDLHQNPKDLSLYLRGKWLIEVAEMHSFNRADNTLLKSFLTRQEERYRPPYAHKEVIELRQCTFAGTTNKSGYLRDETGGRRFWPLICGVIDLPMLRHARDQLFAEAAYDISRGAAYWPDADFEQQYIAPQQAAAYEADAWEQLLEEHFAARINNGGALGPVTVLGIAREALHFDDNKLGTHDQRRIAAVLERLGWTRKRTSTARLWFPP